MNDVQQKIGKLIIDGDRRRDAVHIAVASVVAGEVLMPGDRINFSERGNLERVGPSVQPIGIVDPFLAKLIQPGERFWMFLLPNTVTGMRHVFSHPAFRTQLEEK